MGKMFHGSKAENGEEVEAEAGMTMPKTKTPAELAQIKSLAQFPVPDNIKKFLTSEKKEEDTTKKEPKKRRRNLTTGTFLTADYLPQSWCETKLVCRTKVEEDPDVLKCHQELVAGKSVSELGQIHGFEDFPVPSRIQTLIKKKRVLKSTEEKEGVRSAVSRSVTSLSSHSLASFSMPESLKTPLAVKSVVEDQDLVARNKE